MVNRFRRFLIRFLAGRMPVCINMRIWGEVEYDGLQGGAICENNHFIEGSEEMIGWVGRPVLRPAASP